MVPEVTREVKEGNKTFDFDMRTRERAARNVTMSDMAVLP
jgi:hypothetical protein